jgi:hypothetical protein
MIIILILIMMMNVLNLLALEVHTEDGRLFGGFWRHEEHVGLAVGKEGLLGGHHVALVIQLDVNTCK